MKFLIDTRSLQAATHFRNGGERLSSFLTMVEEISGTPPEPSPGEPNELRSSLLKTCDCLVLTTRPFLWPLSPEEIEDIGNFVEGGSSLLVMSNHPSLTGTSDNDFVTNDNELARAFEFSFQPADSDAYDRGCAERVAAARQT